MKRVLALVFAGSLLGGYALDIAASEEGAALPGDMTNPGYVPHPDWFKQSFLDIAEDIEEASEEDRHLMLYFYQDGCPYCKMFIENDLGQHDIAEYAKTHLDLVAINIFGALEVIDVDGEALAERDFAMKIGVMFTPTLITYAPDGSVAFRINGYYPPPKFRAAMRFIAEKRYANERFVEFFQTQEMRAGSGRLHSDSATIEGPPFDLSARDKLVLVLFEQQECLACDELHEDILRREETRKLLESFEVAVLDIREKQSLVTPAGKKHNALDWAVELGVQVVPTQVLFDGDTEVIRNEGHIRAFHVQSILDYVASGSWREQENFQRYLQKRADHLREQGVAINLME